MKNFLITGKKKSGKSATVNNIIQALELQPEGFSTLPYASKVGYGSYYFHSRQPIKGFENDQPISKVSQEGRAVAIAETIATLGVECLKQCLIGENDYIVLDELGRFEQYQMEFINQIFELLDSEKIVIAIIKKEEIPYLNQMKQRKDVMIHDLDNESCDFTKNQIVKEILALRNKKL